MRPITAAGLLIGVLSAIWMFMMGFTGWYKDPSKLNLFFIVIFVEIAGLIWGLRRTAAEGRTYSGQVVAGTLISIVAGIVIVISSVIFTAVAFPSYFNDVNAVTREMMLKQGKSETEITEVLTAAAPMQTPLRNAMTGFIGTVVTGVIVTAFVSLWVKAESPRS